MSLLTFAILATVIGGTIAFVAYNMVEEFVERLHAFA